MAAALAGALLRRRLLLQQQGRSISCNSIPFHPQVHPTFVYASTAALPTPCFRRGFRSAFEQPERGGRKSNLRLLAKAQADEVYQILCRGAWNPHKVAELESLALRICPVLLRFVFKLFRPLPQKTENVYRFFLWAGEQGKYKHSTDIYNDMLKLVASCPDCEARTRELLMDMRRKACPFDCFTFKVVIEIFGRIGNLEEAINSFNQMETYNCRPNILACTSLIWSAMINDLNTAAVLHKNVLQAGYRVAEPISCQLFEKLYNEGEQETALSVFQARRERGLSVNCSVYAKVISMHLRADREEEAMNLLNEAKQRNCSWDSLCYLLIREMCRANKLNAVRNFVSATAKKGCKIDLTKTLIKELCMVSDFQETLDLLSAIFDKDLQNVKEAHMFIADQICKSTDTMDDWGDKLVRLIVLMESKGLKFDLDYLVEKVQFLCENGKASEAMQLVDYLLDKGQAANLEVCHMLKQSLSADVEVLKKSQSSWRLKKWPVIL